MRRVRMRRPLVSEKGEKSEFEPLAKRPCSTRNGRRDQVSYFSSVSTFCQNEIKDRNYKSTQQNIFISFSFSGKNGWLPLCSMTFLLEIFQSPL